VKITRVTIQNFLGLGEAELELDDRGLVLVEGDNKDDTSQNSNGSGKSSLIDTVMWCLYGKTARGLTGDEVINEKAGKECIVTVTATDGSDDIVVTRWRSAKGFHKKHGVSLSVNGTDMTGGTDALTQTAINEAVGCSEDVFKAAVYSAQEEMVDIPMMTDRELKSLIENAANIDLIETAYTIAKERARDEQNAAERLNDAAEAAEREVARQEEELKLAERDVVAWEELRSQRIEAEKTKGKTIVAEARKVAEDIKERTAKHATIEAKLKATDAEINMIEGKIEELDNRLDAMAPARSEADSAKESLDKAKNKLAVLDSELKRATSELDTATKRAESAEGRVGEPCDECGRPLGEDELCQVIENAKNAVKSAQDRIDAVQGRIKVGNGVVAKLQKTYDTALSNVPDTSAILAEKQEHRNALKDLYKRSEKLTDALNSISGLSDGLNELKRSASAVKERIKEIEAEDNPHTARVKRREEQIQEAAQAHLKALDEYDAQSTKAMLASKTATEVFGPRGVRAHILDTVTPYLNDRTSHYISALSDGNIEAVWSTLTESKTGELKEKFSITVTKYGTGSFKRLSGGEKRKVRLATMLALQDLVASRATKPIDLWVGDEIDEALDTAGLERLMGLLEMKARDRGTVLIVSHNDLKLWVRDVVTVTMENQMASVQGVICP